MNMTSNNYISANADLVLIRGCSGGFLAEEREYYWLRSDGTALWLAVNGMGCPHLYTGEYDDAVAHAANSYDGGDILVERVSGHWNHHWKRTGFRPLRGFQDIEPPELPKNMEFNFRTDRG